HVRRWFEHGERNACYNRVDRHDPTKLAIVYGSEDGCLETYTYGAVLREVCAVGNVLRGYVGLGDCVAIYMPMCPEAAFAMLACARLGVTHNVVFGGYSAESLRMRIDDSDAKIVLTVSKVSRAGKEINFLETVKSAVSEDDLSSAKKIKIIVMDRCAVEVEGKCAAEGEPKKEFTDKMGDNSILFYHRMEKNYEFVPCVPVNAEHRLFYLYTSGSTGNPKGIYHSTGGYLLYAMMTAKYCFDMREDDVFLCTADFGWITGHTYTLYGPLLNGITTVLIGGTPLSTPTRMFELIKKLKVTQFYTAPTLIRMLMKATRGSDLDYRLESLRIIGSVGEPLNKDAYLWYRKVFGQDRIPLIDTYWQTEAGGVMISPIPGVVDGIPECAALPFFGMQPKIVNELGLETQGMGKLVFAGSWPGIARGIINDERRFFDAYFNKIPGYYFTGDEGYCKDGLYWIQGRVDDVINVSAHRISTAEIESIVCGSKIASEAAVVAVPDPITGHAIVLFVVVPPPTLSAVEMRDSGELDSTAMTDTLAIEKSLRLYLRKKIGPIINPKQIFVVKELPKTSTGKLMRRVLRSVLNGEDVGDLSTCMNSASVNDIRIIIGK
ncbi:Acetyl-coenzyme A synthetase, partial [Dictyocoela roeselum]